MKVVRVDTALEMYTETLALSDTFDIGILSAAVADYRPANIADEKIKKAGTGDSLTITLEKTADILKALGAKKKKGQILIGFALETGNAEAEGRRKLQEKGLDLIVINDATEAGAGFEVETNRVTLVHANGESEALELMSKRDVADELLDRVEAALRGR